MLIVDNIILIYVLYFIYGLTFLFLGASIALRDMSGSQLKISNSLWLLSLFGFTHGAHEWIEIFLLSDQLRVPSIEIYDMKVLSLIVVGISFLFLLLFGLSLIFSINKNIYIKHSKPVAIILFALMLVCFFSLESSRHHPNYFSFYNNILRKIFGFSGSLAATIGLILYSQRVKKISAPISGHFLFAGIGFSFYGVFAGLTPSNVNIPLLPIPVEVFRAICAILITYFLFKALNIFDIYTRRKLEEQLKSQARSEKMISLGLLSAGVAHEINSPLTNASLNMQMLRSQFMDFLKDEKIQKKLDAIERNIERASIIAKELLQFSQTQETMLTPMDVNEILDDALALLNDKLSSIKISRQQEDLPDVKLNAAKLEQVFLNVINNSVESMGNNPELYIKTQTVKNEVHIIISDNGTGISAEHLPKIFDPFFTTKKNNYSTGLGLSICHGIIEQHGGTITLVNNKNGGIDTTIRLPIH